MGKWQCEKDTCNWTGDYPAITPSYIFLGTREDETEEEYLETCPVCGTDTLAMHNFNHPDNQMRFFEAFFKARG